MQLIQVTCKFPGGAPRVSQSGREYVAALFVGPDGQEHRVYAPPTGHTTEALQQLRQGQVCRLAVDAKGKAHLCLPDEQAQPPMGFHPQPQAPQVQQQSAPTYQVTPATSVVGDSVIDMATGWHRAFSHLVALGVDPQLAAPAASTITIQLGRR